MKRGSHLAPSLFFSAPSRRGGGRVMADRPTIAEPITFPDLAGGVMKRRPVPDAGLPDQELSRHAPIWWGSTVMITIEGGGLAILIVTYFYIRQNFDLWPPPGTPLPELGASTLDVAIL